jgi:ComF family protein
MLKLKSFLSLWLKFPCALCQRTAENTFCSHCQKKLFNYQLSNPKQNWTGKLPLFVWGKYDGELSRAIAKLKYYNSPEIGIFLGNCLGKSWLDNLPVNKTRKFIILPIPLFSEKLKQRGFNQAELIASGFCQITNDLLVTQGLIRTRDTLAMFGLNPLQRENNIRNAFQVSKNWQLNPPNAPVLLLDDIYTRGTTVIEATKTLRQYNINIIGAIALAKAIAKSADEYNKP